MNVRAAPKISLNSDHALLIADYGARLSKVEQTQPDKIPRYRAPNEEQKEEYNKAIKSKLTSIADCFLDLSSIDDYIVNFTEALHKAAEETLTALDPAQKRSYISEDTWKLIQERQTCRENGKLKSKNTYGTNQKESR